MPVNTADNQEFTVFRLFLKTCITHNKYRYGIACNIIFSVRYDIFSLHRFIFNYLLCHIVTNIYYIIYIHRIFFKFILKDNLGIADLT